MPDETGVDFLLRHIKALRDSGADVSSPCIEWPKTRDSSGYGGCWYDKHQLGAHRVAFKLFYGDWPKFQACHHCDNAGCVNPLHLYDADQLKNVRDGWKRGRYPIPVGPRSKLPSGHIERIFDLSRCGVSNTAIAKHLGLSQPFISRVVNRKRLLRENIYGT